MKIDWRKTPSPLLVFRMTDLAALRASTINTIKEFGTEKQKTTLTYYTRQLQVQEYKKQYAIQSLQRRLNATLDKKSKAVEDNDKRIEQAIRLKNDVIGAALIDKRLKLIIERDAFNIFRHEEIARNEKKYDAVMDYYHNQIEQLANKVIH